MAYSDVIMESVRVAFSGRPDLEKRISDVILKHPSQKPLFEDIAQHIAHLLESSAHNKPLSLNPAEPQLKKRKLQDDTDSATWGNKQNFTDISFSIPVRKKLKLQLGLLPGEGLRGLSGSQIEVSASWPSVRHVFCLPVPEKAQAQYNFCIVTGDSSGDAEQILWTVPEAVPKEGVLDPPSPVDSTGTYRTHLQSAINGALKKHKKAIIEPDEQEFASQIVQAHRKGEKAYHVKAFRGSKDGFLFFLSTGIFWGFKKPLEFFAFDAIDSVSYTSVLQRTFNLNIVARASSSAEPQEFEFSMLDQVDFAGIDAYIKTHQLQDASMAEQRRAKKVNVNGVKAAEAKQENGGSDGEGELEKAAREAQDLEDEDEEDDENFDPGSEGESEGEGSESDEDGAHEPSGHHQDDDEQDEPDDDDEL